MKILGTYLPQTVMVLHFPQMKRRCDLFSFPWGLEECWSQGLEWFGRSPKADHTPQPQGILTEKQAGKSWDNESFSTMGGRSVKSLQSRKHNPWDDSAENVGAYPFRPLHCNKNMYVNSLILLVSLSSPKKSFVLFSPCKRIFDYSEDNKKYISYYSLS